MSVWKYCNSYRFRVMRQGRVITGAARTPEQAKELEAKALLDLHAGRVGRPIERTLEEAMLKYLDSPEFTLLRSSRKLESHLRAAIPYVEGRSLSQAVETADEMKRDLSHQRLQPATINRRLQIIRRVCNLAYKCWGWLDQPIAERIELLPENNEQQIYLTIEEAEALIEAVEKPEARAAVAIAVYTGLRAGEIFRLTRTNILGDMIVIGMHTKNNKPKAIPILPEVLEALAFVPLTITYRNTIKYFWKARQAIGRPDIRFHDLRHTLASWLVQSGATLKDVQSGWGIRVP